MSPMEEMSEEEETFTEELTPTSVMHLGAPSPLRPTTDILTTTNTEDDDPEPPLFVPDCDTDTGSTSTANG